ncbi:uncharacterized protein LOC62_02G002783 [Vanrija pseudolonga]|uniref:Uncharacterized protein n=1 Tax=Vanrija pseudolonga TaxID=143232 RepID=A0AAF0Y371_9TREE|nr:hypothetical protein LOC62_02G002783 [Vanrija pseudolonga]
MRRSISALSRQTNGLMLARRARVSVPSALPARLRSYSSDSDAVSVSVSDKIVAVPFKQKPRDARDRLLIHGLLASAAWPNVLWAGALRLLGTGIEPFGKEFGFGESVTFKEMKAAYWPVWRVDLMAEGTVEKNYGVEESKAWLSVREGYIPGNPFAPLSYLSYAVPPLPDELPTYDPSRDLKQLGDGYDIVPVPFTVSPLGMLDKIRREIGRKRVFNGIRVDESKWKEQLFAAYPLLFPMYIAEFEVNIEGKDKRTYQIIMDAHDENPGKCRVSFPPPDEMRERWAGARPGETEDYSDDPRSGRLANNYYVNPATFLPTTHLIIPSLSLENMGGVSLAAGVSTAYSHWMSPGPTGDSIPPSPTLSVAENGPEVDWSDPRIQSWASDERIQNGEYLEMSLETTKAIGAFEAMNQLTSGLPDQGKGKVMVGGQLSRGKRPEFRPVDEVRGEMEEAIQQQRDEVAKLKPQWLVDFESKSEKTNETKETAAEE